MKTWAAILSIVAAAVLAYFLGSYFGIPGQNKETKLLQQIEQAKAQADLYYRESSMHLQTADELRDRLTALQAEDVETETIVKWIPADPKNLEECKQGQAKLLRRVAVVTEQRNVSNQESLALRDALTLKSLERDRLAEALEWGDDRYKVLERSKKREKRRKIAGLVISHVAVFGVGYGVGTIRR